MKRKLWLLAMVGAMLVSAIPVLADGDFYVVAVGGGVGTKITSVPYTISQQGFYYLGGNLTHSGITSNAITIDADNVTLDLMGFSLTNGHPPSLIEYYGIVTGTHTNIEIRNGTVRGFHDGISLDGGKSRIINIRALGNTSNGIYVGGSGNQVRGCTACNTTRGISIAGGTLAGCTASDNSVYGFFISGTGLVIDNVAYNNTTYNFWFASGASKVLVERNAADGLNPNYFKAAGVTGVTITSDNVGTP